MKKLFAVLFICVGTYSSSPAQYVSIGPNAGYGGTWIDNLKDKKFKSAGNAGVSLIYSTKSSFGIGVDLKYSFEGGEREYQTALPGTTLTTKEDVSLNYLRVPVKAMWFFGKYGNRIRPKVSLGPSFGFLVGGKTESDITTASGNPVSKSEVDSKDNWDSFDLGVTASAGLNYRLVKNIWFNADVAYLHGLTDIRKDDSKNVPGYLTGENYKNKNLQVNIGVNFGL